MIEPIRCSPLLLALALAGCGQASSEPGEAVVAAPVEAVERGAPITSTPQTRTDRARRSAEAIQFVAQGLQGMDLSQVGSIRETKPEIDLPGVRPIAWSELSLRDLYGDRLRELLESGGAFPESVSALDEERVAILGYMIPFEFAATEVTEFMLVRDLAGCCFGGVAQPDEWISVTMQAGGAEYIPYETVVVIGTLTVGKFEDWTYSTGCYSLSAESVRTEL